MVVQPSLCRTWWETPKTGICKTKVQLISIFVFALWIAQSLYFLNKKFQASGHFSWLYSPVCVGPGGKPQRQVTQLILFHNFHKCSAVRANGGRRMCLLFIFLFSVLFSFSIRAIYDHDPNLLKNIRVKSGRVHNVCDFGQLNTVCNYVFIS